MMADAWLLIHMQYRTYDLRRETTKQSVIKQKY